MEILPVAAAPVALPASASMTAMTGGTVPINSAIFAPGEAVAFWYNTWNRQALPLETLRLEEPMVIFSPKV
jgi:hypothetical protein